MTVPTTTPGTLGRVRAWITKTPPSNERSMTRRVARGSRAGEWVNIRCQVTGAGGRLYDRVGDYFVPDEYVRTFCTGRIPGAPTCKQT